MSEPNGWRKSSRSGPNSSCVEVRRLAGAAAVRDSKDREAGYFTANPRQWAHFVDALENGRFDS